MTDDLVPSDETSLTAESPAEAHEKATAAVPAVERDATESAATESTATESAATESTADAPAPALPFAPAPEPLAEHALADAALADVALADVALADVALADVALADDRVTLAAGESAFDGAGAPESAGHASDADDDDDDDLPHLARISIDDEEPVQIIAAPMAVTSAPEIPLHLIDNDALWVVRRLRAKGHEAYLTGGCVRDLLLGRTPKDFDVATAAHPDEVRNVFRNCRLIGRRFRLAHVYFPSGKVIETATFRANPLDLLEDLPEDLLVERDNVFGTVEEDARRRDLTINGLFYDPLSGKVLDFVEGRRDLEARLIRTIGDPEIRFQEDPVRILRAIKFATRLGFGIEEGTLRAMRSHVEGLARCAAPRLLEEISRLLSSGYAGAAFELCEQVGVLRVLLPEVLESLDAPVVRGRYLPGPPDEGGLDESATEDGTIDEGIVDEGIVDEGVVDEPAVHVVYEAYEAATSSQGSDDAGADARSAPAEEATLPADGTPDLAALAPASAVPADGASTLVPEMSPVGDEGSDTSAGVRTDAESADEGAAHAPAEETVADALPPALRRARFFALLRALDEVRSRGVEVSSAVSLGTLLLTGYETYEAAEADGVSWLEHVTGAWSERVRLTRHDRDTLRYLFRALEALKPEHRRGASARHLVSRPWFREALLLYTLSLHAAGESLDEVARWKVVAAHYQQPYKQPRTGERTPRPRRMRRTRPRGGDSRRGDSRRGGRRR